MIPIFHRVMCLDERIGRWDRSREFVKLTWTPRDDFPSAHRPIRERKEVRDRKRCEAAFHRQEDSTPSARALSRIDVIANETGVTAPLDVSGVAADGLNEDTGVPARVAGVLRLCAMWLLTRWPAARALQRLNSPASTPAATIRASFRAFSPGVVA